MFEKSYRISKKDINEVPFHLLEPHKLGEALGSEIKRLNIPTHSSWIIPQLQAKLANEVTLVRGENGLFSPSATVKKLFDSVDPRAVAWWKGALKYLVQTPRKSILDSVSQIKQPENSALVPLALAAFKKFRKVGYSEWDYSDKVIEAFIDRNLLGSIFVEIPEFLPEELLECRRIASEIKSGAKAGSFRTSAMMYNIYSIGDAEFDRLPNYTKVMLLQTWIADPKVRSPYMILDPVNIDNIPEPLEPMSISESNDDIDWSV